MPTHALLLTLLALAAVAQTPATVRGKVLDDDGKPIAGVAVCPFVAGEPFVTAELAAHPAATTDADGEFVLDAQAGADAPWDRVLLVAPGKLHIEATREQLASLPVVLPRGAVLAGRVRDAGGRPVAGVRVEATDTLHEVEYVRPSGSGRRIDPQARTAVRTDARGAFALVGACETAARVTAASVGWRPASAAPVSAMEPIELVVEPAPVLRGLLVDEDDMSVPGILVSLRSADAHEVATSDAGGTFTFTAPSHIAIVSVSMRRGDRRLYAREQVAAGTTDMHLRLRVAAPARVRTSGEARVAPAPLHTCTGTLQMRPPALGVAVRFKEYEPNTWSSGEESDYSSSFPVGRDGRFQASGIPTGTYEAQLILLRPGRQGMPDKVPLGIVEVRAGVEELRLDGVSARPAYVRGRVEGAVPAHRLAVLSAPAPDGIACFAQLRYTGPLCPVGADGSFALQEPPGSRSLAVIDHWTGAMLYRGELAEVAPGGERQVTLRVDAVPVVVRLAGEGLDPIARYPIEIVPGPEQWPGGVGQIAPLAMVQQGGNKTGMGATLSPGQTTATLYLPLAPCDLKLRPDRWSLERTLTRVTIDPRTAAGRDVLFSLARQ